MKTWIKTSIAAAIIATGALGTTVALSWGGLCDGTRGGKAGWSQMASEDRPARMTQRANLSLARLELALALTPEQKPAFEAFKTNMQERATRMAATMGQRRDAERPQTAVERMDRMQAMSQLRQSEMVTVRQSVETFYATLSDAQKTVFDAEFQYGGRMAERGMRGGPREGHRMGVGRS